MSDFALPWAGATCGDTLTPAPSYLPESCLSLQKANWTREPWGVRPELRTPTLQQRGQPGVSWGPRTKEEKPDRFPNTSPRRELRMVLERPLPTAPSFQWEVHNGPAWRRGFRGVWLTAPSGGLDSHTVLVGPPQPADGRCVRVRGPEPWAGDTVAAHRVCAGTCVKHRRPLRRPLDQRHGPGFGAERRQSQSLCETMTAALGRLSVLCTSPVSEP